MKSCKKRLCSSIDCCRTNKIKVFRANQNAWHKCTQIPEF
ncbi:hypothetical protein FAEPRAM212_02841 [Faecalibacterium prausnitzii M21/2]|uniref:Uncharacterized protein n=1 Tax=Faecalibacterium prausnitzii M21/2 TaxID=411485 RepID=A8SFS9_9FIRM|nr:hypothetical protein FAEPRAM212_02841 [Faecalibacterium prausnitzii M21/2]